MKKEELTDYNKKFMVWFEFIGGDPVLFNWLLNNGFFEAPASRNYHGNFVGGLMVHSVNVAETLSGFDLKWENPRSPLLIGLFHDLCKIDQYRSNGECYRLNENKILQGHGSKSVMLLSQFFKLTEEEIMCIRFHMGAYEKDDWESLKLAIKKFPNVLWTHHADMMASTLIDEQVDNW